MNKEIPILFSTPMIQAILDGDKTMTRRIINPQPYPIGVGESPYGGSRTGWEWKPKSLNRSWNDDDKDPYNGGTLGNTALSGNSPYGKIGNCLWVRETTWIRGQWKKNGKSKSGKVKWKFIDKTIGGLYYYETDDTKPLMKPEQKSGKIGWYKRPAIFSPRKASRLFLEITNIKAERLQQISQEDAKAEGIPRAPHRPSSCGKKMHADRSIIRDCYICAFRILWNRINGSSGKHWENNPWVWVISFKKISK